MAGRKTLYTPARVATILDAIRLGNDKKVAAVAAGVGQSTFYRWLEDHQEFREAIEKAEADAETRKVGIISTAAEDTWTAAAWWLERKHPDRWARRPEAPTLVQDNRTVNVIAGLSDEQIRQALGVALPA